jgi:putative hydrolase of the HAD superfamily
MSLFKDIRCVAFDLDDTLWPSEPTISNAEHALYEWLSQNYSSITKTYSLNDIKEHRADFANRNTHLAHDVTALRRESLAELAEQFGYPLQMANEGLKLFRRHRNQISFFADALPTLRILAENFKIGAITNGNADLGEIGAKHYFDFVVTAQDAGAAKPDIKIFEYARKKIGFLSHELLFVGDHPMIDIVGSSTSGWKSLWFNPDNQPWPNESIQNEIQPDAQIQKLSQLVELLNN